MSNHIRTALRGGGRISAAICLEPDGTVRLQITEDWSRLTSVEKAELSAEALNAAPDPDGVIFRELETLVQKAHILWEARQDAPEEAALDSPVRKPDWEPVREEGWTALENLSTPAGREAVGLELFRSFYTVRLRKRKEGKKTAVFLEYKRDCQA